MDLVKRLVKSGLLTEKTGRAGEGAGGMIEPQKSQFFIYQAQSKSVVKRFFITAADGKNYSTNFYNLDVITSVGCRVKSRVATQFRIWATHKEFLSVRHEGSRDIKRRGSFYTLDLKTYSFAKSRTSGERISVEAAAGVFEELRKAGSMPLFCRFSRIVTHCVTN